MIWPIFPLDFRQFRRSKLWQVAVNLQSPAALRGTVSLHYSLSVSFHISFLVNFLYQISSKKLISTSVDISSNSFNYQPLSYRTSTKYLSSASGSLLRSKQPGRSLTNWSTLLSCKPPKHDWNWCRKSFTVRYGVQKSEQYKCNDMLVELRCGPLAETVTTMNITFLVGDSYKPSFTTVTERGPHPR